jgi:murein DD-endopeptidase MepM/ murein hydrolase activator NlpD
LLKRGQLIGLSGASNDGLLHLHFGINKVGGSSQKGITIPIACKAYAKQLIAATEK